MYYYLNAIYYRNDSAILGTIRSPLKFSIGDVIYRMQLIAFMPTFIRRNLIFTDELFLRRLAKTAVKPSSSDYKIKEVK